MSRGTSQNDRMPGALDPKYFKVDERTAGDLYKEAQELAEVLAFYNTSADEYTGTWSPFFEEKIPELQRFAKGHPDAGETPPHLGLFWAFLKLFGYSQDQLNALTASHLHFFYQKVLGLEKKKATPDKVFIFCELARNIQQFLIPEKTPLSAGKDDRGNERIYKTDRQTFLSHAYLSDFKTVRSQKRSDGPVEMFPVANSRDGLGAPLEEDEGWHPFGAGELSGQSARIGFGVESPVLILKEGIRTVHLSFSLAEESAIGLRKPDKNEFEVLLSGSDGWIRKDVEAVRYENQTLTFSVRLGENDPPVVQFDKETHVGGPESSEWPVLIITLKPGFTYSRYAFIQSIRITGSSIRTEVEKARSLMVRNDFGELEADKAFHPFGYRPAKGATLFLGLKETFVKSIDNLSVRFNWKGLPDSFKTYYEGYLGPTNSLVNRNEDFKVKAAIRRHGGWMDVKNGAERSGEFSLFQEELKFDVGPETGSVQQISYERAMKDEDGLIRLRLTSPDHAFGHSLYPSVYAKAIMSQMQEKPAPIPNEPYTPVIESVEMDYSAQAETERFFYIKPFGIEQILVERTPLVSGEFHHAGTLYMGIENLHPPQQLTIFFELEQEIRGKKPAPELYYLSPAGWKQLPENQVLSDTTLGLKKTGIILLNLPSDMSTGHTEMPADLHWIRISVDDHSENFDRILNVRTNAVTCTLKRNHAVQNIEMNALPPNTIKNFSKKRAEVRKIEQPYPSFGGRPAEKESGYFTRVSERLRHKDRAVTSWDMERLILEEFPQIYKVSCLPHRNAQGRTDPGNVHIIVIPFLNRFSRSKVLKPVVPDSTLAEIKTHIERLASSNITVQVTNPFFEEIRIIASVSFHQQADAGYYVKQLQHDLQRFLSPWAFRDETEIQLGSKLYRSSIIEFIESRQYINFIASIRLLKNGRLVGEEEISPDMQTLIVSSESHEINAVEPDGVVCQTNQGIEQMIVDVNFEVQ